MTVDGHPCYNYVAKGVTALCLLRPCLLLTQLSRKGECAGVITVATARAEGEGVRHADKPCGLSAHARTEVFAIGRAKIVTEYGLYLCETNRTQSAANVGFS